jgi:hypothetical protein
MFAKSGAKPPPGLGTSSPAQVGADVIRAIERNQGEINVAPLGVRLGATIGALAPELARMQRRLRAERPSRQLIDGQRNLR